jgi:hypothetical protein
MLIEKVVAVSASIDSNGNLVLTEMVVSDSGTEIKRVKAKDYNRFKDYK